MEHLTEIQKLVSTVVKAIVTCPDEVEVTLSEVSDERGDCLKIHIKTAVKDVSMAIGSGGATVDTVKKIVVLLAAKLGYRNAISIRVEAPYTPKK